MIYHFKCESGHETEYIAAMADEIPPSVICLELLDKHRMCNKEAKRVFGFAGFKI